MPIEYFVWPVDHPYWPIAFWSNGPLVQCNLFPKWSLTVCLLRAVRQTLHWMLSMRWSTDFQWWPQRRHNLSPCVSTTQVVFDLWLVSLHVYQYCMCVLETHTHTYIYNILVEEILVWTGITHVMGPQIELKFGEPTHYRSPLDWLPDPLDVWWTHFYSSPCFWKILRPSGHLRTLTVH